MMDVSNSRLKQGGAVNAITNHIHSWLAFDTEYPTSISITKKSSISDPLKWSGRLDSLLSILPSESIASWGKSTASCSQGV